MGFVPFLQLHRWSVRSLPSFPPKNTRLHGLLKRKGIMILPWNQGSRSWEIWPVSAVYHSRPATPCSLTKVSRAMDGHMISSESFSFHPSAFHHCLSEAINLPSPHWVVRRSSLLFSKRFENKPPFVQNVPISNQLKQLQPAWGFSVRVGSTCWA